MTLRRLLFKQISKDKKRSFKTRNLKKDNPAFLKEYNSTEFIWTILRVKGTDFIEENTGVIQRATNYINEDINNLTVLDALNNYGALTTGKILNGDCLTVKEKFVFDAIKNVRRKPCGKFLSLIFLNNKWTVGSDFFNFKEIEVIDEGEIILLE